VQAPLAPQQKCLPRPPEQTLMTPAGYGCQRRERALPISQ
jgi:hypothetical protein